MKNQTLEDLKCPICGRDLISLEYPWDNPQHYDGISEYFCPQPGKNGERWHFRIGRWSGKILKGKELELLYGGKNA